MKSRWVVLPQQKYNHRDNWLSKTSRFGISLNSFAFLSNNLRFPRQILFGNSLVKRVSSPLIFLSYLNLLYLWDLDLVFFKYVELRRSKDEHYWKFAGALDYEHESVVILQDEISRCLILRLSKLKWRFWWKRETSLLFIFGTCVRKGNFPSLCFSNFNWFKHCKDFLFLKNNYCRIQKNQITPEKVEVIRMKLAIVLGIQTPSAETLDDYERFKLNHPIGRDTTTLFLTVELVSS